jgi:hypothetical protein
MSLNVKNQQQLAVRTDSSLVTNGILEISATFAIVVTAEKGVTTKT